MYKPTVIRQMFVCKRTEPIWEARVCYGKTFHIVKSRDRGWIAVCDKCNYQYDVSVFTND